MQGFTPLPADAARFARHPPGDRRFVDETYAKVNGGWRYVYRAIAGRQCRLPDLSGDDKIAVRRDRMCPSGISPAANVALDFEATETPSNERNDMIADNRANIYSRKYPGQPWWTNARLDRAGFGEWSGGSSERAELVRLRRQVAD